ncbi:hypothetical protein K2173_016893 [Erythroxylum novogranatense]|uniref:AT-hook motif nuclear-localized protein n=1 Tax=Erythroxylum novogranatense TaxID=1862640 RepID=A0AAV8U555_9ROSI|nr:hypothetical protein K2173_016893 [Erythroxylum novogranatense]
MDSREPPSIPPHTPSYLHQHHHPHHQQHNIMLDGGPTSSYPAHTVTHPSVITTPNLPPTAAASGGFPFNSVGAQRSQVKQQLDGGGVGGGLNSSGFDGSSSPSSGGMRFSMETAKKKRGRPRKYNSDGNIALGLAPTPAISSGGVSVGHADSSGVAPGGSASEPPIKRNRGRPPGSGKKQLDALGGVRGVGFTPHVITVKTGEDIASKIKAFSQQGPRTVCILSANGAICNVTLRQPAMSVGTVTYEGRYEIISLSGSYWISENDGNCSRDGGLSVSLAGSDGRVLGGGVAGVLQAASPVQVIVGSFIADSKPNSGKKSGPSSAPAPQLLNFNAPLTETSPPCQGASSESSDENDGSPMHRGPGIYGNPGQPIHGMQMYQLWGGQNPQ